MPELFNEYEAYNQLARDAEGSVEDLIETAFARLENLGLTNRQSEYILYQLITLRGAEKRLMDMVQKSKEKLNE